MEPPYRGHGDYGSDEREEHRHSPFHHGAPPPPPHEGDVGERRGGPYGRREDERFGRGDEEGFGRRRGDGRFDDKEGYPPEHPPHFPHQGVHGLAGRPHYEEPPHDAHRPSGDAPPHSEYKHGEPWKEPDTDATLSHHMGSLSLELPQGQTVRIFCKENSKYNLVVEHNSLEMQESNIDDEAQQWIKDVSYGMRIKDSYGYPAFSLVNKKTRKMLKHANEQGQQVLLVDYQADMKDDSILWTESQDFGEGFKTVRSASDTLLNLTVFEGNKKIRNGSALVLDTWHKGDHQLWKIFTI